MASVETHLVQVNADRTITVPERICVTQGSYGVDQIEVQFVDPSDWAGLSLVVTMSGDRIGTFMYDWDGSSPIMIDQNVTPHAQWVSLGIVGTDAADGAAGTQNSVTAWKKDVINVVKGSPIAGDEAPEPIPTLVDKLVSSLETMDHYEQYVEQAADAAAQAKADAATAKAASEEIAGYAARLSEYGYVATHVDDHGNLTYTLEVADAEQGD